MKEETPVQPPHIFPVYIVKTAVVLCIWYETHNWPVIWSENSCWYKSTFEIYSLIIHISLGKSQVDTNLFLIPKSKKSVAMHCIPQTYIKQWLIIFKPTNISSNLFVLFFYVFDFHLSLALHNVIICKQIDKIILFSIRT